MGKAQDWSLIKNANAGEWGCGGHRFSMDIKERTCGNSRGVHEKLWPWNFHQQGVSYNFAEFAGVKACFLREKRQI